MAMRIAGEFPALSSTFTIEALTPTSVAAGTITLTDGDLFPDALAAHIQAQVIAADAAYANFTCTVDATTGIFSMVLGSGETATLVWVDTALRDWMRYSGVDVDLTDVASAGSRVHKLGFYPDRSVIEDLPVKITPSTQSVSDTGIVHTVSYSTRTEHDLTVRFFGGPRDSTYEEYTSIEDWVINCAAQGKRWRFWPDVSVTAAFVPVSEPYGYHDFIAALPLDWKPQPTFAAYYKWFTLKIHAFEYVS